MNLVMMVMVLVLGSVVQAVWPAWEVMGQSKVPILLGIVLYYSFTRPLGPAIGAALLAGLLQDALSRIPLGYSSFMFILIVAALAYFRELLFVHQVITQMVCGALGCLAVNLGLLLLLKAGGYVDPAGGWVGGKIAGSLILGLIAVPILCLILSQLDRQLGHSPASGGYA